MSCKAYRNDQLYEIRNKASVAISNFDGLEWSRVDFPAVRGVNALGVSGWNVPRGTSYFDEILESIDGNLPLGGIPNEWYDREYDLSQRDHQSPQNLATIRDMAVDIYNILENHYFCSEISGSGWFCFDDVELDTIMSDLQVTNTTAQNAMTWPVWNPYLGAGTASFFIGNTLWLHPSEYEAIKKLYNTLIRIRRPFDILIDVRDLSYDCKHENPPEQDNADCEAIIAALEGIADNLENLELSCPEPNIPEFDYDRVINAVKSHIDSKFPTLSDHIDSKFPEIGGQHIGAQCGLTPEPPDYSWQGEGFIGLAEQLQAVQKQLNSIEERLCPEIKGTIPYSKACERGFEGEVEFDGRGLQGIQSQLLALAEQVDKIQQNLCLHAKRD
ncbi:MAG: hypothetical protein ACPGVO_18125 [Spirulinaceae cyanobacterium]